MHSYVLNNLFLHLFCWNFQIFSQSLFVLMSFSALVHFVQTMANGQAVLFFEENLQRHEEQQV